MSPTQVEPTVGTERFDELSEQFFSQPPPASDIALEPWAPEPMSTSERRAMWTTAALLTLAGVIVLSTVAVPGALGVAPAPLHGAPLQLQWTPEPPVAPAVTRAEQEPVLVPALAPALVPALAPAFVAAVPRVPRARASESHPLAALVKRAHRELDAGRASQARALALDALERDASYANAYVALGSALERMGDREAARRAFQACVANGTGPLVSACRTLAR